MGQNSNVVWFESLRFFRLNPLDVLCSCDSIADFMSDKNMRFVSIFLGGETERIWREEENVTGNEALIMLLLMGLPLLLQDNPIETKRN